MLFVVQMAHVCVQVAAAEFFIDKNIKNSKSLKCFALLLLLKLHNVLKQVSFPLLKKLYPLLQLSVRLFKRQDLM
jgi:hypothetical protein